MHMRMHTPGPWRIGKCHGSIVADSNLSTRYESDAKKYYGGNLICESVCHANAKLIQIAPDMYNILAYISESNIEISAEIDMEIKRILERMED